MEEVKEEERDQIVKQSPVEEVVVVAIQFVFEWRASLERMGGVVTRVPSWTIREDPANGWSRGRRAEVVKWVAEGEDAVRSWRYPGAPGR